MLGGGGGGGRNIRPLQIIFSSLASRIRRGEISTDFMYFFSDDVRLAVTVEEFPNYCKLMHANSDHLFSEEYEVYATGHMTS